MHEGGEKGTFGSEVTGMLSDTNEMNRAADSSAVLFEAGGKQSSDNHPTQEGRPPFWLGRTER